MKRSESGLPFDDFRGLVSQLPAIDAEGGASAMANAVQANDGKSDRLVELCAWVASISTRKPIVHRPLVAMFAGTHGVELDGEKSLAHQWLLDQVISISAGVAGINQICDQHKLGLKLLDLALEIPVADISQEAAIDEKACAGTIAFGMEAIAGGTDLMCVGAIEPAPKISAMALISAFLPAQRDACLSLLDEEARNFANKALLLHVPSGPDGFEMLRRLGGRETAGMAGAMLAARMEGVPVLISGWTALASACVLWSYLPDAISHCRLVQPYAQPEMQAVAEKLGLSSVFDGPVSASPMLQLAMGAGHVKSACLALGGDNTTVQ